MNGAWICCPLCKTTNVIIEQDGYTTYLGNKRYTDVQEVEHYHNSNQTTRMAKCINGHVLRAITYETCHCGWRLKDNELIYVEADNNG